MTVKVIEVVQGPVKHTSGYSVKVKAVNPMGNVFDYQFIKNLKSDADLIVEGFEWEYLGKRKKWL